MKSQDLFSLRNKKKIKMSSAAIVIGALRVKVNTIVSLSNYIFWVCDSYFTHMKCTSA